MASQDWFPGTTESKQKYKARAFCELYSHWINKTAYDQFDEPI